MLIFLYIVLFMFLIVQLLRVNKTNGFVGGYSGFTFSMMFFYIIIPLILFFMEETFRTTNQYGFEKTVHYIYDRPISNFYISLFYTILAFVSFNIGYKYKFKLRPQKIQNKDVFYFDETNITRLVSMFSALMFIIGSFSLITFTLSVGGVNNALALAEVTRGFETSLASISYIAGISKLLSRSVTVSAVLYLYLWYKDGKEKYRVLMVISFILSFYFYLTNAGRTPLTTFLIIFVYFVLEKIIPKTWIFIIILSFLALPAIDLLSNIFIFFEQGIWVEFESDLPNTIRQFSAPYYVLMNVNDIVDIYGYQYFRNLIFDILSLIPRINLEPSFANTSEFFNGLEWRNIGGMPNDVISFGFLQLNIPGIVITMGIWGKIIAFIDRSIKKLKKSRYRTVISTAIATQVFQIIFAADIGPIIQSNVILTTLLFILILYRVLNKHQVEFTLKSKL